MGGRGSSSGGSAGSNKTITKTISDLVVGDTAYAISSSTRGVISKKVTVTKVTKTQITTDDGNRWFRNDGERLGQRGRFKGTFVSLHVNDDSKS